MTRSLRLGLLAAAGAGLGANFGTVLSLLGKGGFSFLLLSIVLVFLIVGVFAICWTSLKEKSLSDRIEISALAAIILGSLLGLAFGLVLLANAFNGWAGAPFSTMFSMCGLGCVLFGLAGLVLFVKELGLENTRKNAAAKVADSQRLLKDQNVKDAEEKLREALLELELAFGSLDPDTAKTIFELGNFFAHTGEQEKAGALYKRSLSVYEATLGPHHALVGECLHAMGQMEVKNDPDVAILLLRRALSVRQAIDPSSLETGMSMFALAGALAQKEKHSEAEEYCRKAQGIVEKKVGASHPETLMISGRLAGHSVKLGKFSEAEKLLQNVISEREKAGTPEDAELVGLLVEMGRVLNAQNRAEQAQKYYLRALNVMRRSVGPEHPLRQEIFEQSRAKMVEVENAPNDYDGALTALLAGDTMAWRKHTDANPGILNQADGSGWTPLQWAVFLGHDRMIEGLLFAGAEVAPADGSGMPPLLIAARWGNRKAMQNLINKGADLNQTDANGWTALHCVAASGDERTIEPLVGKNADLSLSDREGYTPLHVACIYGSTRVAVEMISRGAKIDIQSPPTMSTPLHVAAQKGNTAVAQCLAFNGADLTLKDSNGKTAADVAATSGHHAMVKFFEQQQRALHQHQSYEQKQALKAKQQEEKEKEKAAQAAASGKQKTGKGKSRKAKTDG